MPNDILFPYRGKRVGFVGRGISNLPIAELFASAGIDVTVRDRKPAADTSFPCHNISGDGYLENITEDILFLAPAVRGDLPELEQARKNGVRVTSEMEEFFAHCPCKIIAVTGSDGKTTTTTLISELLKHSGKRVFLGGNIGANLFCRLPEMTPSDWAVCELSSFQLMKMPASPHIAVVTNLSENHLDWHRDLAEYKTAKKAIVRFQKPGDICVLNADCPAIADFSDETPADVIYTSGKQILHHGVSFNEEGIFVDGNIVLKDSDIFLVGKHNRYNYCTAIAATLGLCSSEDILHVARTFAGVKHRIQFVRELNGVKYYNSSIDSSPTRTAAALHSFNQKLIVLAGGHDKKISYESIGPLFEEKAKAAILTGETAPILADVLARAHYSGTVCHTEDMLSAVKKAHEIAVPGDIVILSPAASSFDLYKNFEERGNVFIDCVNKL